MAATKKLIDSDYSAAINCKHGSCWFAGKCEKPDSNDCAVAHYRNKKRTP